MNSDILIIIKYNKYKHQFIQLIIRCNNLKHNETSHNYSKTKIRLIFGKLTPRRRTVVNYVRKVYFFRIQNWNRNDPFIATVLPRRYVNVQSRPLSAVKDKFRKCAVKQATNSQHTRHYVRFVISVPRWKRLKHLKRVVILVYRAPRSWVLFGIVLLLRVWLLMSYNWCMILL